MGKDENDEIKDGRKKDVNLEPWEKSEEKILTEKVLEEEKRKVERGEDEEELERERKIIEDWDSITSDAKRLWFLKKYWRKIAEKGLKDFLEPLGITVVRKDEDKFVRVLWRRLEYRYPETMREWLITTSPDALTFIYLLLEVGVDSKAFRNYLKEWYEENKDKIETETSLTLPSFDRFYNDFKDFILRYRL